MNNEERDIQTCPYYIVHDRKELRAAAKLMGGAIHGDYDDDEFPIIVGMDDKVFTCQTSQHPIPEYWSESDQVLYRYELHELPAA